MPVRYLPSITLDGPAMSSPGGPDHPMRLATRRAAGLDAGEWHGELRDEVKAYFDAMADEWHTRTSPQRAAIVRDALTRGLEQRSGSAGPAVEVGSGTGAYSPLLAERFGTVVAIDLSHAMLRQAPDGPAWRVQADGSALPLRDGGASAVVLINAFLFPAEVARVLAPHGVIVWVNSSGERTPIYLSPEDLLTALPGEWTAIASQAGDGHWCVLRRGN